MSSVRVLVGTRKGAFILTADAARKRWEVEGPHFAGWEIYHVKGAPADPDRLYASQSSGWFGQVLQRSNDGGKTWETGGNQFLYEGTPGPHTWYDGSPHPWEFKRVWHLEPSPKDPDMLYAGAEDAALFTSTDAGQTWGELPALRTHQTASGWAPGAGGLCLHTILLDPNDGGRIVIAISSAGVFKSDDSGQSWRPANRGLRSNTIPDQDAEVGHCVHHVAMHPSRPDVLFMQKHWDVMRSDDGGGSRREISRNLPTDLRVVIQLVLPKNLQILAGVGRVVELEVGGTATQRSVLDALEASHPSLLGTVRDQVSKKRRPMVRFFACEEDISEESPDAPLPEEVASGKEPLLIIGAIAGG